MRILADVQCLQGADPERGIPRWSFGLVSELSRRGIDVVGLENPDLGPVHEQFRGAFSGIASNTRGNFRNLATNHEVIYLCLSPMEPVRPIRSLLPTHVMDSGVPLISVLYDFALYLMPEVYQVRPGDERTYVDRRRIFSVSDLFLCISNSTLKDAARLWSIDPQRLVHAGSGLNPEITNIHANPDVLSDLGINRNFVLTVGRADPRKQTAQVIRAFAGLNSAVRANHQLVIACQLSDSTRHEWTSLARECGLADSQLILPGRVADDVLAALYRQCRLFVEPSLYEGFGLPAAEAAVHGAAVITSNTSSLPEILDLPESQFDPTSLDDMIRLLERGLTDEDFRERLTAAGGSVASRHNWTVVVDRVMPHLLRVARSVEVPRRDRRWFLDRGFPPDSIGRTIPTSNLDA